MPNWCSVQTENENNAFESSEQKENRRKSDTTRPAKGKTSENNNNQVMGLKYTACSQSNTHTHWLTGSTHVKIDWSIFSISIFPLNLNNTLSKCVRSNLTSKILNVWNGRFLTCTHAGFPIEMRERERKVERESERVKEEDRATHFKSKKTKQNSTKRMKKAKKKAHKPSKKELHYLSRLKRTACNILFS